MEALKEMDDQIVPWFQAAAAELLHDMPAEKALALALAKITGNTELKASNSLLQPLHAVSSNCIDAMGMVKTNRDSYCIMCLLRGSSWCTHLTPHQSGCPPIDADRCCWAS